MSKILRQVFSWKMLILLLMGMSSGLPLALTGGTLKAWMTDAGVDLTTIGFFSFVGLPYTLKFLWAPFTDRFTVPGFGRRRGWVIGSQLGLVASTAVLAFLNPSTQTSLVAGIAIVIAFFSATQDIVLDAYRREILEDEELGFGTSMFINGYLLAMRVSSFAALAMAQYIDWKWIYLIVGGSLVIGIVTVLLAPEPKVIRQPKSIREAVIGPLQEFFTRPGVFAILLFILLYKAGDTLASEMTIPFLKRGVGFEWIEIATIVKAIGIWAMPLGTLIGGALILKIGINRSLWIFGVLQAVSTFGFALLAEAGPVRWVLAAVIVFENLTAGMGTSAYSAFMARLTNREFTATQYALLSSLMGVPRVILSSGSGMLAERIGWYSFFTFCAIIAIPGMLLLLRVAPWNEK
ncbi:MAG: AmpG family muropeptide MFS transporter, partial [Bdellovibrionaceae bacterium]|nr:AmpG family muropeptide MFS transporter [Pseudobdellovibrionaceae bacterium]